MKTSIHYLRALSARAGRSIGLAATGGAWSLNLTAEKRYNLRWFWLDGLFAAASDNIVMTYLVLYLLALGASGAQIGWMSSLSSLSAALLLLPGAMLVERLGHRKHIVLLAGGLARLALLLLALLPLIGQSGGGRLNIGVTLAAAAMALAVSRDALGNLAYPAWIAITADIVPVEGRGRYFASRNFAMGAAGIAVTLAAGELITRAARTDGFQISLAAAFGLGLVSTYCFSRIYDKPQTNQAAGRPTSLALARLLTDLRAHPSFLWLSLTAALWNFSLNIAGPFFTVHLVENLQASAAMVALTAIATTTATLASQRKLGELADRWGARRMQLLSGMMIPVLPLAWVFVTSPWQVIPINLLGGVLWGAYNLASFTFLLAKIPPEQRARYSAIYQVIVMISLSLGAALGGLVLTHWGYTAVFLVSCAGRVGAVALFARQVRDQDREKVGIPLSEPEQ